MLGPGLLLSAYRVCFSHELALRRLSFQGERHLSLAYKGFPLGEGSSLDFVVEGRVVVKLLAVEKMLPVHQAQLRSQLRLSGHPVGLLINFNVTHLREGLHREVFSTSSVSAEIEVKREPPILTP